MNRQGIVTGIILAVVLGSGALLWRTLPCTGGGTGGRAEQKDSGSKEADNRTREGQGTSGKGSMVTMDAEAQKQNCVVVAQAKKELLAGALHVTGKIEANGDRIAHVFPRIPGRIVTLGASLGEKVAAGQPLATLESIELIDAINTSRLSKTKVDMAQSNLDRIRTLVEKKIAAEKELVLAESEYKSAMIELQAAEQRLLHYGAAPSGLSGHDQKKTLLVIRAPFAGIVTEKHAIAGEPCDPTKLLYTITDLSSVWVALDISEKDLAKVRKGQSASISVGAYPDVTFEGRITFIADLVDQATRTVKARVEIANPERKLKPEMFATVDIALQADAAPVLAVPEEALQNLDGHPVVFVADSGTGFTARQIQAGRRANGMAEIVSGLKEGERYAVKGAFILKSEVKKGELSD